jgi:flavodoxin
MNGRPARSLVIVSSYHHKNTGKVATVLATALGAEVRTPQDIAPEELRGYEMVGFGSGIDSDKHYKPLLDLAARLPRVKGKKAFIFSTCGMPVSLAGEGSIQRYLAKSHAALREILISRGYAVVGEYSCPGFNTNSFLRLFGGLNRGRPNAEDLNRAEEFARALRSETA